MFKGLMYAIGAIVIIFILMFVSNSLDLISYKFFAPKREAVRREVFEETKSYNQGKVQDLVRYRLEYLQAESSEDKEAIASTIRMMFADYDENTLEPVLRDFLKEIKY